MATPPLCDFDWKAPDFTLPGTDGKTYALADHKGENGTLVAFICCHCPYVLAIIDRLSRDARDLDALGIKTLAICSNDGVAYPDDNFDGMTRFTSAHDLPFPYLHDESQAVARAYDAVCTPDFFGFDANLGLQYRGRLDASRASAGAPDLRRDLFEAMKGVAETGKGPAEQIPSMGCSIKWRAT